MTNNIYSMLAAYFQYQRDIGIDEMVFDRGSEVVKMISGNAGRSAGNAVKAGGYGQARATATARGFDANRKPADKPAAENASPFARLTKLKTVDSLNVMKFEKPGGAQKPASSDRRDRLAALYREVLGCGKCATLSKVVFGTGNADGRLLIIGGAPAPQDESAGLPFQDEAGGLLGKILDKMGLDIKKDLFATYLQKCRNGGAFTPKYAEACRPVLDRQIDIIEPKAILVFGQSEANFLLSNNNGMEQLRSEEHKYKNIPVIVTYGLQLMHEDTTYRHGAWDDMKKVLAAIG